MNPESVSPNWHGDEQYRPPRRRRLPTLRVALWALEGYFPGRYCLLSHLIEHRLRKNVGFVLMLWLTLYSRSRRAGKPLISVESNMLSDKVAMNQCGS